MKSLILSTIVVALFCVAASATACDALGVVSQRACVQSYSAAVVAPVVQYQAVAPVVQYQAVAPIVQYQAPVVLQQQAIVQKQVVQKVIQRPAIVRQRIIQRAPILRQRVKVVQSYGY